MTLYTSLEELKADTLDVCRKELGDDSPYWSIWHKSLWETELMAEASKAVSKIEAIVAKLESAQLKDRTDDGKAPAPLFSKDGKQCLADGVDADGTLYFADVVVDGVLHGVSPDRMSDLDTPAYVVARILRDAVERAKAATMSGSKLAAYVAQFDEQDRTGDWRGAVMQVEGLSDREVAVRALLQGYWPNSQKEPRDLKPPDIIEMTRKAVHACRAGK